MDEEQQDQGATIPPGVDPKVASSARVYDFLLGGKDNFKVDRKLGLQIIEASPNTRPTVWANRRFMIRVARHLADKGIRQFLDVGTGLPTSPNLHEVVQGVDPTSRIVYVDNDKLVLAHARALLTSTPEGETAYIDADMREPDTILRDPQLAAIFDLSRPVAVTLIAVLHHVSDDTLAAEIAATLMSGLTPGSALAISVTTIDNDPNAGVRGLAAYRSGGPVVQERTHDQVTALFGGLLLEDPGVVLVHRWRPDEAEIAAGATDEQVFMYGGVAIKR
jgi:hypothetical protein